MGRNCSQALVLTSSELSTALLGLAEWEVDASGALIKNFAFRDFAEAFSFMTRVALVAERLNHHPDWSNSFNKVQFRLWTHSIQGVSQLDVQLAHAIEDATHLALHAKSKAETAKDDKV